MSAKYKILFVCLGNICRSPAAEGIMKKMVEEEGLPDVIMVDSAGILDYHEGELPDKRMRDYAFRRGYKLDSFSSPVKLPDFEKYDLIIGMDDSNYDRLRAMAPNLEAKQKVRRMREFLQNHSNDHIPDPYYGSEHGFELVLDLLEDGCKGLIDEIRNSLNLDNNPKAALPQDS